MLQRLGFQVWRSNCQVYIVSEGEMAEDDNSVDLVGLGSTS
jgi:hypothetical protein